MGKPIGELLVEAKALTREKLEEALKLPRDPDKKIGHLLVERGYITEAQLTQCLSFQLSVPWVSLYHIDFTRQLLARVPRELAERNCMVPIYVRHVKGAGDTLYVAIEDPTNQAALNEASSAAALPVRPMIASASDIRSAIRVYYGGAQEGDAGPAPASAMEKGAPATERKPEPPPLPPRRKSGADTGGGAAALAQVAPPGPAVNGQAPAAPASRPALSQASPAVPPSTPPASSRSEGRSEHVDSPDAAPEIEAREITMPGKRGPRMLALTLLDGTSIKLPAPGPSSSRRAGEPGSTPPGGMPEQLTSRDLVSALRALSHGADVTEILGESVRWEAMFAALLSLLLKKGIVADWEFVDELRKG